MLDGIVGGAFAVIVFIFILVFLRSMIRVCPSNHILVVTGGTKTKVDGRTYGFRLQKGGWTFVIPFLQSVQYVDLSIIPIDVKVEGVNSANGINVGADATACVCIDDNNETLLYSAVQQLLGKSREQIQEQIRQTMIGNFRAALNKTTPLQAIGMVESADGVEDVELAEIADEAFNTYSSGQGGTTLGNDQLVAQRDAEGERAIFRQVLLEDCQQDLSTFGIEVVSVSLQRIWDTSSYIANLANKTLSRKRKEVEIEEARLSARAERAESDGGRRQNVSVSHADSSILEVQQEVEVYRRQCAAEISRARLESDSAISEAQSQGQRQIEEMKVELQELKNRSEVTLLAEAQRQAAEIVAGGDAESINAVKAAENDLLEQKVVLLSESGDAGRVALFINQFPTLFDAYQKHAGDMKIDKLLVMDENDGFNNAVNRGPAAMVNFLKQMDEGFGINIRELMTSNPASNGPGSNSPASSGSGSSASTVAATSTGGGK